MKYDTSTPVGAPGGGVGFLHVKENVIPDKAPWLFTERIAN